MSLFIELYSVALLVFVVGLDSLSHSSVEHHQVEE